jgi:diguanylate cyclase (GGDEF)-like protein
MTTEPARLGRLAEAVGELPRRSRPLAVLLGAILLAGIGLLDVLTGYEIAFSLFYLLPIAGVAWFVGKAMGIVFSVVGAALWLLADAAAGHVYSHVAMIYWNSVIRFGFFLIVSLLLAAFHRSFLRERELSRTDSLTGAANGRHFTETMRAETERARRYGRPFTLVYLDVDDFKKVNDSRGHGAGDTVLRAVAVTIREHLRATDTVSRLGGDEFALLLPETDQEAARSVVTKMRSELLERLSREGWAVTFSIGALTCVGTAQGPDALITAADELMYRVKRRGKDNVEYAVIEGPAAPRPGDGGKSPVP